MKARQSGLSGGHSRDGGVRPRWRAGASSQADTRATASPDPEGAPARPLKRTRARRRCPTTRARQRVHHEGAPACPLRRKRARQRRPIPGARRRGPSGGDACDGGARSRGHASTAPQADMSARPRGRVSASPQADSRATFSDIVEELQGSC